MDGKNKENILYLVILAQSCVILAFCFVIVFFLNTFEKVRDLAIIKAISEIQPKQIQNSNNQTVEIKK